MHQCAMNFLPDTVNLDIMGTYGGYKSEREATRSAFFHWGQPAHAAIWEMSVEEIKDMYDLSEDQVTAVEG